MAFENNVQATLQANVAIGATTVDVVKAVAPNKDVPASGRLTLSATGKTEIISYTGRTDNTTYWTLTGVTKNAESSFGDQAWSAGDACFQALTAADVASLSTIHSATAPTNPTVGTKWFNTTTGVLQEYLTDGTDFAWLDISAGAVAGASGSSTLSGLSDTTVATTDPLITSNPSAIGHLWVNSSTANAYICTDITTGSNVWINIGVGTQNISASFSATGGIVSTYSSGGVDYKVHTFISSGTFVVANQSTTVDVLVVAGGGSGGGSKHGAGGGAGGFRTVTGLNVSVGSLTVTVGAGANSNAAGAGSKGADSTFSTITSEGGGLGGSWVASASPNVVNGGIGGSGGGAGGLGSPGSASTNPSGQGYAGGNTNSSWLGGMGGGGGAGGVGGNGGASVGGIGGIGLASDIRDGTSVMYAGGGGAGGYESTSTGGTGGNGGGGNGNHYNATGSDGTANTGGGGGGSAGPAGTSTGGNGGSGIVIVRYLA